MIDNGLFGGVDLGAQFNNASRGMFGNDGAATFIQAAVDEFKLQLGAGGIGGGDNDGGYLFQAALERIEAVTR